MIKRSNFSDGTWKMVSVALKSQILNKLGLFFFTPYVYYVVFSKWPSHWREELCNLYFLFFFSCNKCLTLISETVYLR